MIPVELREDPLARSQQEGGEKVQEQMRRAQELG